MTPQFHDVFVQFILSQSDMTELELYLTTPGGNPFTGFNLYGFIKSLQVETTGYNIGTVDSAGVQFLRVSRTGSPPRMRPLWCIRFSSPGTSVCHPCTRALTC